MSTPLEISIALERMGDTLTELGERAGTYPERIEVLVLRIAVDALTVSRAYRDVLSSQLSST